jgi:hypothetical protein
MKIKLHSMTDLITNSSTVIYTYSENSKDALEDMINEVFKVFGVDKKCKDVFTLSVDVEDDDCYGNALESLADDENLPKDFEGYGDLDWEEQDKMLKEYVAKVKAGEIKKPEWMKDAESGEDSIGFRPSTTLTIEPKAPKYKKLADLVSKFLYSTEHDGGRDG